MCCCVLGPDLGLQFYTMWIDSHENEKFSRTEEKDEIKQMMQWWRLNREKKRKRELQRFLTFLNATSLAYIQRIDVDDFVKETQREFNY
jgi:hypothetical protein